MENIHLCMEVATLLVPLMQQVRTFHVCTFSKFYEVQLSNDLYQSSLSVSLNDKKASASHLSWESMDDETNFRSYNFCLSSFKIKVWVEENHLYLTCGHIKDSLSNHLCKILCSKKTRLTFKTHVLTFQGLYKSFYVL